MRKFVCTMSYELGPETPEPTAKLLRAELCGRRWRDRVDERLLPRNTLWIERSAEDHENTGHLHDACSRDLKTAAEAVRKMGFPLKVLRAWIQVSGGGTFGFADGEHLGPEG
jgi:hypothetical protein